MACACKYNSLPGIQLPIVEEERSEVKLLMAISLTIFWKRSYPRNEEAEKQHKNEGISPRFRIFFGAPRATPWVKGNPQVSLSSNKCNYNNIRINVFFLHISKHYTSLK